MPLGFYESFFGSGNGFFTSAVLTTARGFVLLEALGYYYTIACVWCVFASSIYVASGHYDLKLILPAICGSVLGASVGSRLGKKHGSKFVKNIFMAIGGLLGLKLLLGF
ncbi:MAG: sulfite exporter TauE/SafE family protein [Candidatus Obscuribacter sp.]|nr:sulfite exporter TauE/SafE family protein [Candidatus Obscuribacter sp.]